jgi:hypothetical protein
MTQPAAYCNQCGHKAVCKIRQQILDFDQLAQKFETDNTAFKLTIINVNYSCVYKKPID